MQGGQNELIIHGENGFLFDHEVNGDLESKIKEIETLPVDKIQQIRKNAIVSVSVKHNYERVYNEKSLILNAVLANTTEHEEYPFAIEIPLKKFDEEQRDITKGLLSIVIPYYNMGKYIEETLLSVINNSYAEKEIIIIDDGSSDSRSVSKLTEMALKYPIKVFRQENQGLAVARNVGAKNANGEFLLLLMLMIKFIRIIMTKP
ncbi:MAG: glycosyltransferase family 2 protein [Bacteroidota bacterium]